MRQTLVEKILSEHSGKRVKSGDMVIAGVDACFSQDDGSCLVIDSFRDLGAEKVIDNGRFSMVMDHGSPSPNIGVAAAQQKMRAFSREHGNPLFDVGSGVCHQVIPEAGLVTCGDIVIGTEAHSSTYGAINALGVGVGASDIAITAASGKCWFKVPETIKVTVDGTLPKGVYPKDVALDIVKNIGASGANYRALEFSGKTIDSFGIDSRFTIANMAAETGAKCGLMKADKKTLEWAKRYCRREPKPVEADSDARYAEIRKFDVSEMSPKVAKPHSADNVCDIDEVLGTRIDIVTIGTCTNGRFEDMEAAAKILKGKKIARGLKLLVTPASKKIYLEMVKKGLIEIFVEAGAVVNNPGCGPCSGTHQGVLADGETAFSTGASNYRGRMGNMKAEIYLGSPATAAATAVAGKISDPREYKRKL